MKPTWRRAAALASILAVAAPAGAAPERVVSPTQEEARIVHVLSRLGYGPRPGDVESVRRIGLGAWVDRQLHPERIADDGLLPRLSGLQTLGFSSGELMKGYDIPREARREIAKKKSEMGDNPTEEEARQARRELLQKYRGAMAGMPRDVVDQLQSAKVLRAVYSERQLDEVLVDFWMNHFNVYANKGQDRFLVGEYEREAIRPHAWGKFADPSKYAAAAGAEYPRGRYGDSLKQIAQLVKADVGLEVAFTEVGGWDHHAAEGGVSGQLAVRLGELGQALAAFHKDLGDRMSDVVVLTLTEFGRTVAENGNRGTDHGHASVSFVLGGTVRGGRIAGRWPGLSSHQLYEGRDLAITTDFRDLVAEVLTRHLGSRELGTVFPGHPVSPKEFPGVMRA
jgi:hypothetical protein